MEKLAVYVHIPFCPSKCPYCDFNSYAMRGAIQEDFTRACVNEILRSRFRGATASSVFFGGGTPTFVEVEGIRRIFGAIERAFAICDDAEISIEANPGTVDSRRFAALTRIGFNRVSIGAQSFDDDELRLLGRIHDARAIPEAVSRARDAGFENLNLDLMYGIPRQTLASWNSTLEQALALGPTHLSLYCLTIEPNTPFYDLRARGKLTLPGEMQQIAMERAGERQCSSAGLTRYEISNYAMPGYECQHNIAYWQNRPYVGFGPGAVSYDGYERWMNVKSPRRYVRDVDRGLSPIADSERVGDDVWLAETLMVGLRMIEGVPFERLIDRVPDAHERLANPIQKLRSRGWLEIMDDRLRLTSTGLLFHDEVAMEFLP